MPAEAEPQWIGRVIDERYRITAPLGEGGMGTVFIAEHLTLKKEVALKVIQPHYAGHQEVALRFAREAVTTANLEHPHIVGAFDFGELPEGGAYLVMQLVRGQTLRQLLDANHPFTWETASAVARQMADAVAAAHAKGVVHRDLKPENVLVELRDDGPFVRITDFGIARIVESGDEGPAAIAMQMTGLTRVGVIIGTPGYMPPEQAMGEAVDERADLYALGVILWEMLAGELPFDGATPAGIVTQQLMGTPALPLTVSVPKLGRDLLDRMLAPKAENRPSSAVEVRAALGHAGTTSLLTSTWSRAVDAATPAVSGWWTTVNDRTSTSWKRWAAILAPVLVLAAVAELLAVAVGGAPADSSGDTPAAEAPTGAEVTGDAPADATAPAKPQGPVTALKNTIERLTAGREPPPEVKQRVTALDSDRASERRAAAKWLLAHKPENDVPDYARAVAKLETTRTCAKRKEALEAIRDVDDERALPFVERLHESERRGCGFLGLRDCYACIRSDLAATVKELKD
ncbi:MAG: serine/threonine-protein kinase [Polyangiales bacterium]